MFRKKMTVIIALITLQIASISANELTNQTMKKRITSALQSSYEFMQEKAARTQAWIRHRINAFKGKSNTINEHPEELIAAPSEKKSPAETTDKK